MEQDEQSLANTDLLRTIKLQKNVFKLELPQPTYGGAQSVNYQTMPA